jgi:hypothetical protein
MRTTRLPWLSFGTLTIATLCAAAVAAVSRGAHHHLDLDSDGGDTLRNAAVVERQDLEQRLRFAAGTSAKRVDVDNFDGPVRVVAEDRDDVALVVHETVSAESRELLAQARKDVTLERVEDGPTVRVRACGPWTDRDGRCCSFQGWNRVGYRVQYAIEARVPRSVTLLARTVENGDVRVEGVRGDLRVENVNGSVSARGVAGRGTFGTVNGDLEVLFAANPEGPSSFSNVNGNIDVEFRPGLAADVRLKTLNGEMWSDFPYAALPVQGEVDRRNGRFVYSNHHTAAVRIAGGGPELRFETVNGEIRLRRKDS